MIAIGPDRPGRADVETACAGGLTGAGMGAERFLEREMQRLLAKHGVKPIEAERQKFDPHKHQAIGMVDSEQEANTVVTVLQKGYLIADRTLRPALVMVAKQKS